MSHWNEVISHEVNPAHGIPFLFLLIFFFLASRERSNWRAAKSASHSPAVSSPCNASPPIRIFPVTHLLPRTYFREIRRQILRNRVRFILTANPSAAFCKRDPENDQMVRCHWRCCTSPSHPPQRRSCPQHLGHTLLLVIKPIAHSHAKYSCTTPSSHQCGICSMLTVHCSMIHADANHEICSRRPR